jgi:phosphate uptake regulator
METRKVQLSGGTTYTISLPKPWAQEHGIDSESLVALHPNGDASLLIEVVDEGGPTDRTAVVDIGTADAKALEQQVIALYVVGFDSIELRDSTGLGDDQRRTVDTALAELSGFELIEATNARIRVKSLIDAGNVDVRKSALRLRLVTLSMLEDALSAIVDRDSDLACDVVRRDTEADKLFAMVTRHFRRSLTDLQEVAKLAYSRDELFEYYYVCRQFERVADHAEKMATFASHEQGTIPDPLAGHLDRFGEAARAILEHAADVVLLDADVEMAHEALARRDVLCGDIDDVDRELYDHGEPDAAYTTGLLLDSIGRIANYGANVAEIGVQQALRENAPPS